MSLSLTSTTQQSCVEYRTVGEDEGWTSIHIGFSRAVNVRAKPRRLSHVALEHAYTLPSPPADEDTMWSTYETVASQSRRSRWTGSFVRVHPTGPMVRRPFVPTTSGPSVYWRWPCTSTCALRRWLRVSGPGEQMQLAYHRQLAAWDRGL